MLLLDINEYREELRSLGYPETLIPVMIRDELEKRKRVKGRSTEQLRDREIEKLKQKQ